MPVFTTADSARYNRTEWKTLLAGLNTSQYRSNSFLYQATPNTSNCDPGALKSGASSRFLNTVNLIRRLHNLPPVSYDSSFATQMQETALVQLANNYLSHSPATGDKCYSAAARTAGSSKYGLERVLKVIMDLMTVKFLDKYMLKPMYLFGFWGMIFFFASFVFLAIFVGLTSSDLFYRPEPQPVKVDASELQGSAEPVDVKALIKPTPASIAKGKAPLPAGECPRDAADGVVTPLRAQQPTPAEEQSQPCPVRQTDPGSAHCAETKMRAQQSGEIITWVMPAPADTGRLR